MCADGCPEEWVNDDACDPACQVEDCWFDGEDCRQGRMCAPGCPAWMLGDGQCDDACNVEECQFDLRDCSPFRKDGNKSIANNPKLYGYRKS